MVCRSGLAIGAPVHASSVLRRSIGRDIGDEGVWLGPHGLRFRRWWFDLDEAWGPRVPGLAVLAWRYRVSLCGGDAPELEGRCWVCPLRDQRRWSYLDYAEAQARGRGWQRHSDHVLLADTRHGSRRATQMPEPLHNEPDGVLRPGDHCHERRRRSLEAGQAPMRGEGVASARHHWRRLSRCGTVTNGVISPNASPQNGLISFRRGTWVARNFDRRTDSQSK